MDNEEAKNRLKKTVRLLIEDNIPFSLRGITNYLIKNKEYIINREELVLRAILAIQDAKTSEFPKSEDAAYKAVFYVTKEITNESTP